MVADRIISLLFSPKGRFPTPIYAAVAIPCLAGIFGLEYFIGRYTVENDTPPSALILIPLFGLYWIYACALSKRLHDFSFTGLMAPALAVLMMYRAAAMFFPETLLGQDAEAQEHSAGLLQVLFLAAKWIFRLTVGASFLKPSDPLDNIYGPPFGSETAEDRQRREAKRFQALKDELGVGQAKDALGGNAMAREMRKANLAGAPHARSPRAQPHAAVDTTRPRPRRPGGFGRRTA